MAAEEFIFSVASVVEDVLQQHGARSRALDFDSRRAEEAALRRTEASEWLRKMVGAMAAKDLPAEPSEDEFRLGLRSGIILCNALNKVQPGAVPKVVESPCDATLITDGAALSAFQYFENVRNFLVAVGQFGVPIFEASDLEQGGKTGRIVNCVLALKSYNEWKQNGGIGVWKFGGNIKPVTTTSGKSFSMKNPQPFMNSLSRTLSMTEKSISNKMSSSGSFRTLVHSILSGRRPEEIPTLIESVLTKVVEEFNQRIANQQELIEEKNMRVTKEDSANEIPIPYEDLKRNHQTIKQQMISDQQHIQELKHTLNATKAGMQFMQVKFQEEFNNLGVHIQGLAHAALSYHRVLEENRRLYNQVQDLKGNIRVYCRVKPFLQELDSPTSVENIEDGTLTINTTSKKGKGCRSFTFNKVFGPSATQAEVFSDMQPLIRSVLDGYNVCIFAYGQTGSGKTYTMTGPKDLTEKSRGVNYRALGDLFVLAEQRKDMFHYDFAVQMIEIYNERVRDLLVTDGNNKRLEIRNSSHKGLSVPDANLVPVSSTSDVIDLMNLGQRNRAVGATALNDRSSRSHSCLTVHVQGRELTSATILRGCMHLVDLAGSERVEKSEATGDRLKEAQYINKSLSALGDVISSLAQKNSHVPYRNSKLTQLLQDSLGGQAKTLMFVHVSPESEALGETISTLKFAERVATVELGAAQVNKDNTEVKELKEQISSLKAALARKNGERKVAQRSVSNNLERYGRKANGSSTRTSSQQLENLVDGRQPMGDVGNVEVCTNSTSREKRIFDLDELLVNSPTWPPVMSPTKDYRNGEKEIGPGDWVDKVMVNQQDPVRRLENLFGCLEPENGAFCENYLQDPSETYMSAGLGGSQFNMSVVPDELEDLDAVTSDSSEPDLLWQYDQSKLNTMLNGNLFETGTKRPASKPARTPEASKKLNHIPWPSPSRKQVNGIAHLHRNIRLLAAGEGRPKTGNGK